MTRPKEDIPTPTPTHFAIRLPDGKLCQLKQLTRIAEIALKLLCREALGIAPNDFPPGVHLAGIIHILRNLGLPIETTREAVPGDPFGAVRARYRTALTMDAIVGTPRVL